MMKTNLKEILLTFTQSGSKLSSKKIERFIIFVIFLILTIIFFFYNLRLLTARDFIEIMVVWLTYGGYNSFMNWRDKKLEQKIGDD